MLFSHYCAIVRCRSSAARSRTNLVATNLLVNRTRWHTDMGETRTSGLEPHSRPRRLDNIVRAKARPWLYLAFVARSCQFSALLPCAPAPSAGVCSLKRRDSPQFDLNASARWNTTHTILSIPIPLPCSLSGVNLTLIQAAAVCSWLHVCPQAAVDQQGYTSCWS